MRKKARASFWAIFNETPGLMLQNGIEIENAAGYCH
jgi:hypothetical protein